MAKKWSVFSFASPFKDCVLTLITTLTPADSFLVSLFLKLVFVRTPAYF